MATVRDLIRGSLRLIGAVATGETPSAEEQADALSVFNDMLGSWSTEGLTIHSRTTAEYTLVPNQGSYTLGATGTFTATRPVKIESAGLKMVGETYELALDLITHEEWGDITHKSETGLPRKLYIQGTSPNETLQFWPVTTQAHTLVLRTWAPLTTFTNVSADLEFPSGYAKALRYGLALELAPEYGKILDQAIVIQALESKENIKRLNIRPQYMACDPGLPLTSGSGFNIRTGK